MLHVFLPLYLENLNKRTLMSNVNRVTQTYLPFINFEELRVCLNNYNVIIS